jgi:hypothetical protein
VSLLPLEEKHGLTVFENKALRRIFEHKTEEEAERFK